MGLLSSPKDAAQRVRAGLESLFLFLTGVYVLYNYSRTTSLLLPYPFALENWMLWAMAAVAAARLLLIGPRRAAFWLALGAAGVYGMVYRADGYPFLLFLAVMTAGLAGIDYRRVLRLYLIAVGVAFAATMTAALSGGIENLVYFRKGVIRSSWGIIYPTDFATRALFLALIAWVQWRSAPDWALMPVCLGVLLLAQMVADSRNSMICALAFAGVIAWHGLTASERFGARLRRPDTFVGGCLRLAFLLFACAMFLLVYFYSFKTPLGVRLNSLSSGRLRLGLRAFAEHPITAFGTPFQQIGNAYLSETPKDYHFIDSSYVLILLRYGWVTLLMHGAMWGFTVHRALRRGDRRLALAMGVIALHSVMEHHFPEVEYNILLALPLAAFGPADEPAPARSGRAATVASASALAALCLFGATLLPAVLTRLRTVYGARGWTTGGLKSLPVLACSLVLLALIAVAARALFLIVRGLLDGTPPRAALRALACCACLGAAFWLIAGGEVNAAATAKATLVEADAPAMTVVMSAAENPVYSDVLPEVYRRRFGGIRATALSGEDLGRYAGATALMDGRKEKDRMLRVGFRFAQISDTHAIYTQDPAVIDALTDAGYAVTDYYAMIRRVNLKNAARFNRLRLDENGLWLDDAKSNTRRGPFIELSAGKYEATYVLRLSVESAPAGGNIATLCVSANHGRKQLAKETVAADAFDADGRAEITLAFAMDERTDAAFEIRASEPLCVSEIRYQRVAGE